MEKNIVITIARQYGSGGRTIAQMLSERLGIHYYDKELLKLASDVYKRQVTDKHTLRLRLKRSTHSMHRNRLR